MKKLIGGFIGLMLIAAFLGSVKRNDPAKHPAGEQVPSTDVPLQAKNTESQDIELVLEKQRDSRVGDICVLNSGSTSTFIAMNSVVHDRMMKLVTAKDDVGLTDLVLSGLVYMVPSGTKVRLIDKGIFTSEVRILEGQHQNKAGLVIAEFVVYVDDELAARNEQRKKEYEAKLDAKNEKARKDEAERQEKLAAEKKRAEDENSAKALLDSAKQLEADSKLNDSINALSKIINQFPGTTSFAEAKKLHAESLAILDEGNAKELMARARKTLLEGKLADTAVILKDLIARFPRTSAITDAKALLAEIEKK
jgi:hypothetical protein